ncbi:MAG: helix-turn-helix domain-containing protein, partial [Kordiimonas sp.]
MASNQIEDWEVAIIRRLLARRTTLKKDKEGYYSNQEIAFLFSRPKRTISVGRITEISQNNERYDGIAPSSEEAANRFLKEWKAINFPAKPIEDFGPTHPQTLAAIFQPRKDDDVRIAVSETDTVEGKASFNWGSREDYGRTMAGFANNKGGYLLFGVEDKSFACCGIAEDRMDKFDPRKANQYLTRTYNQHLRFEIGSFEFGNKTVGVIYVFEADNKPVVCKNDEGKLRSGDIFFRYPGETARIKEPELRALLEERRNQNEQSLVNVLQRIADIGTNNSAIVDLSTGFIEGKHGQFYLPEELVSQLSFIKDGEFDEKEGAPTLNVIGELTAVSEDAVAIKKVKENLTERDILSDFIEQNHVGNPQAYIERQCHEQARWMPIYFYAHVAKMSMEDLTETLKQSDSPYARRIQDHVTRVKRDKLPSNIASSTDKTHWVGDLLANGTVHVRNDPDAIAALNAICCFDFKQVSEDHAIGFL